MTVLVGGARPLLVRGIAVALEEAGLDVTVAAGRVDGLADELTRMPVGLAILVLSAAPGASEIARVLGSTAAVPILAVAPRAPQAHLDAAVGAGAAGCIVDDAPPHRLLCAVRAVGAGRPFLSDAGSSRDASLPGRLRQVLAAVALGETNKDIAEHLGISVRTVESHRRRLLASLDARGTADLVRYAIRVGIVQA